MVSEINSKWYDICIYCICPNYIPILCIGNCLRKKKLHHCLPRICAPKLGDGCTQHFFFCSFVDNLCFYFFILLFLAFLIAVIIMNIILFHCRLPSNHNMRYETAQRLNEMNEKKRINTAQFNLSLSINHSLLCEHTTRHTFRGDFHLGIVVLLWLSSLICGPFQTKDVKTFLCNFHSGIGIHFMEMIITIFFFVYSGLLN